MILWLTFFYERAHRYHKNIHIFLVTQSSYHVYSVCVSIQTKLILKKFFPTIENIHTVQSVQIALDIFLKTQTIHEMYSARSEDRYSYPRKYITITKDDIQEKNVPPGQK